MWITGNRAQKRKGRPRQRRPFKLLFFLDQFVQGIGISTTSAPRRVRMVQVFSCATSA